MIIHLFLGKTDAYTLSLRPSLARVSSALLEQQNNVQNTVYITVFQTMHTNIGLNIYFFLFSCSLLAMLIHKSLTVLTPAWMSVD